jgi:outer membrane protein OmpA-like peptidoglycan-associated protein
MTRRSIHAPRHLIPALVGSALATLVASPHEARAQAVAQQGEFSVQRLEVAPGAGNFVTTERVRMTEQFGWSAGALVHYAHDPFVVVSCISETDCSAPNAKQLEDVKVVSSLIQADLMGSFNVLDFLQIGLRLPVAFTKGQGIDPATGTGLADGLSGAGLGDPTLEGKARLFGGAQDLIVLGAAVDLAAPLGTATASGTYIGNDAPVTVGWRGIADFKLDDLYAAVNLRGLYRGENTLGSTTVGPLEFRYAAAVGYAVTPILKVQAEGFGSTQFSGTKGTNTLEVDGSVVISPLATGLAITAGGGAGVIEGTGVPLFRALAGVTYSMESGDADGDGIVDTDDAECPSLAEDFDGFQDDDGCPEDDNDGDKIVDEKDKCPLDAEVINGLDDTDGCPDAVADTDKDGIPDSADKCPELKANGKMGPGDFYGCPDTDEDGVADPNDKCADSAEDTDGFEDTDGCLDDDNDKDGVPDASDECGDQPEIKNGFKDEDGCPDSTPDTDKDGIPDASDKCPANPENFNGVQDEDGCPDRGVTLIEVKSEEIKILQMVEFESNSDKLKGVVSSMVLDAVVGALKANPQILKIEVGGHTDNVGDAKNNKDLSQRRADAVKKYLEGKGVEPSRLVAVGYGQDKPIADNKLPTGQAKNRRVEFKILTTAKLQ